MPGILKRRSTPPILAVSALAALVVAFVLLNGGGSQGAGTTGLAGYAPPDTVAYAETDLKPDGRVAKDVDAAARALTGMDLGEALEEALGANGGAGAASGSWAAGPVAIVKGSGRSETGLVAEAADPEAASAFAEELRERDGFPPDAQVGLVGEALVFARSQDWFGELEQAFSGSSLADSTVFADAMEAVPEDSVAGLYVSGPALLDAVASAEPAASGLVDALRAGQRDEAAVVALGIEDGLVSLTGSGGPPADGGVAGAGDLIAGFPAGSILAAGTGDAGRSLAALLEAAGEAGEPPDRGDPESESGPGDAGGLLDRASAFGFDLEALAQSLGSAGVFITGGSGSGPEGALVATTSDSALVRDSIESVTALGAFAGDDLFRPLPSGLDGFSVSLPGMPGRRVAVAARGDRVTVALGLEAARRALEPGARTLGDTDLYREATSTLPGDGVNLFALPRALARLARADGAGKGHGDAAASKKLNRLFDGIETVVAGPAGDGGFEMNLDLRD